MKGSRPECANLETLSDLSTVTYLCLFNTTVYIVHELKSLFETSSLSRCLEVHKVC
jgi:hypothetical protein